jgi:hypothetical protein
MSPPTNKHGICWSLSNCLPFRSTWVYSPLILIESLAFWFCSHLFVCLYFFFIFGPRVYLSTFIYDCFITSWYLLRSLPAYSRFFQKDKATADNAHNAGQFTIYQRLLILKTFYDRYARLIKFTAAGINP